MANTAKNLLLIPNNLLQDALKTVSERAIPKTAETTGDLIDNKIADKITKI